MQNRNQIQIINQINLFFEVNNRKQHFDRGYCHGLTLLWLHKAKSNKLQWFYDTVEKICSASTIADFSNLDKNIERFIYHMEWLQNASKYEQGMTQSHLEELTQSKLIDKLSYIMTHEQITKTLEETFKNTNSLAISNSNHTMGVYKKDNIYMLYDSNYLSGRHKEFKSIHALKAEILRCFFQLNALLLRKFPLTFNIFQHNNAEHKSTADMIALHKAIIASKTNPNEVGFQGDTDLLLAAENGNTTEVTLLLEKGANPNQQNVTAYTPLFLACVNNHVSVVKKLLEYNADPNIRALQHYTPLMCAAAFGLESIMHELLAKNANPLLEDNEKRSALGAALLTKAWRPALILLSHVPSVTSLSKFDLDLINFTMGNLKTEVNLHPENYTMEQKLHFTKLLDELQECKVKKSLAC